MLQKTLSESFGTVLDQQFQTINVSYRFTLIQSKCNLIVPWISFLINFYFSIPMESIVSLLVVVPRRFLLVSDLDLLLVMMRRQVQKSLVEMIKIRLPLLVLNLKTLFHRLLVPRSSQSPSQNQLKNHVWMKPFKIMKLMSHWFSRIRMELNMKKWIASKKVSGFFSIWLGILSCRLIYYLFMFF